MGGRIERLRSEILANYHRLNEQLRSVEQGFERINQRLEVLERAVNPGGRTGAIEHTPPTRGGAATTAKRRRADAKATRGDGSRHPRTRNLLRRNRPARAGIEPRRGGRLGASGQRDHARGRPGSARAGGQPLHGTAVSGLPRPLGSRGGRGDEARATDRAGGPAGSRDHVVVRQSSRKATCYRRGEAAP